jgi:ubiquinone biosynthesis protein
MQMIFQDGLFHADPHPANIMVIGPDRIGLIDFGMVGALSTTDRESAIRLFGDIIDQNVERIPRDLKALGIKYPREVEQEFVQALAEVMAQYHGASMDEIDVRGALHAIFGIIYELEITLPSRWIMLDKALATLAGVALQISPDFNVFDTARPYARRLYLERFSPQRIGSRVSGDIGKYASALLDYPFQMSELLDEFKDGEVHITINLEELRAASDKGLAAANRVAIALIASAVILGSAIIGTLVQTGPHIFGLAWVGVPGFVAGLVLFIWIVWGMIRSGSW